MNVEKRLFAAALFELRVQLSSYLAEDAPQPAQGAAKFAYALHNQALAALNDQPVDVHAALEGLSALEPVLGAEYLAHFRKLVVGEA